MNRQLTSNEIAELASPIMTRKQKLLHWAAIIRNAPTHMMLYNGLEYRELPWFDTIKVGGSRTLCAFGHAATDPTFNQAGLVAEGATIGTVMRFFELSKAELHEFSCNCGGAISNHEMAQRIERLAA